jgi:hypothetical protein
VPLGAECCLPNKGVFVLKKESWLLLGAICSFCIIVYAATMFPQDIIFSEYKKAFSKIQHPARTEFIKTYNSFGAVDKTRTIDKDDFPQGCDYRVAEVREYPGTQESIKVFYSGKTVIVNGQATSIGVLFIPTDSTGLIDSYGLTHDEVMQWGPEAFDILENLKDDQNLGFLKLKPLASYYLVSSGGFSLSNLDFRCQF